MESVSRHPSPPIYQLLAYLKFAGYSTHLNTTLLRATNRRSVKTPKAPNTKSPKIMFAFNKYLCDFNIMKPMPWLAPTSSASMSHPHAQPIVIRKLSRMSGDEYGTITFKIACLVPAPSVYEISSNSFGILLTISATIKTSWKKTPKNTTIIFSPSPIPNQRMQNGTRAGTGKYLTKLVNGL